MSKRLSAPQVDRYIDMLGDFKYGYFGHVYTYDDRTYELLDQIFALIETIEPASENGARILWLKADRGPIEDFGDFEKMKDYEQVETYEEYEKLWKEYYPEETKWYYFGALHDKDVNYRAIFMKHKQIIEHDLRETEKSYPTDIAEFMEWMLESLQEVIQMLKDGTYNDCVEKNLPHEHRTGTITSKNFWDIFPDAKKSFFEDISQEDVDEFIRLIADQPKECDDIKERIASMSANDFYRFCSLGYRANNYEYTDQPLRYQYDRHADGRDEGLSEIDQDSPEAFHEWLTDTRHGGGHPFEVCAGGNSTHIDLFVRFREDGYVLHLAGDAWGRCIETVKFYLALKREGLPVYLYEGKELSERLQGTEKMGIVPDGVFPRYCHSYFPDENVITFMNLPYEKTDEVIAHAVWQKLDEVKLISKNS